MYRYIIDLQGLTVRFLFAFLFVLSIIITAIRRMSHAIKKLINSLIFFIFS